MLRKFDLHLHQFPAIPQSLQDAIGHLQSPIEVELDDVFAHMYWDSYGVAPPTPNPFISLYTSLITTDTYLRFTSGGLGDDPEIKRFESCRFGRALCRWFLHNHCGTPYFTSLSKVLNGEIITGSNVMLERVGTGNTPDYICHTPRDPFAFQSIYFAEAKGRYSALKFDAGGPFDPWRQQVKNVQYRDTSTGGTHYSKGYIVATRLTNQTQPRTQSAIWAEDPNSSGETPFTSDSSQGFFDIQRMIKAGHYASIMDRLNLLPLALSLRLNYVLPREARFRVGVWRGRTPSILNEEFIGGYIPITNFSFDGVSFLNAVDTQTIPEYSRAVFVGLHRKIFRLVRRITFIGREAADELIEYPVGDGQDEGLSILSDGTVLGPIDYFEFSEFADE